jgi:N-sulfoglucosamine sulfohydrolase
MYMTTGDCAPYMWMWSAKTDPAAKPPANNSLINMHHLLLGVMAMAGLLPAAFAQLTPRAPNILWIVSEDNSPNLGCYGDPYAQTPHLDRLAREGVRFNHASVPYTVCSPSRAAFLTGLYPQQNGQLGLTTQRFEMYRANTPSIVTRLKAVGYNTGLIGKLHVRPEAAFPFDYWAIKSANFNRQVPVEAYAEAAAKFWTESGARPWFLSVNFPDAHLPFVRQTGGRPKHPVSGREVKPLPWVGADSERLRNVTADYYNCIARLDEGIGQLLQALEQSGAANNTMVVYFGDHGAQFPRGKYSLYEGGLRVPLLIRWPGRASAGLVREELVSTIDLLPTVLRAAGLSQPRDLLGLDLQPLLRAGPPAKWREYAFAMLAQSFVQESVRDARWKLIWSPPQSRPNSLAESYLDETSRSHQVSGLTAGERAGLSLRVKAALDRWESPPTYELYDLQNDPYEWENLAEKAAHAPVKARLIAALRAMQETMADPFMDGRNVENFAAEQLDVRQKKWAATAYPADFRWSYIDAFRNWREQRGR